MTQSELDELKGTLDESKNSDTSTLRELLDKIPDGFFGDKHESDKVEELQSNANAADMQNMSISPREPEEFTEYVKQAYNQVMPAIQFHDEIMKGITAAVEKIPVLPKVIEQLEEELSRFVFSIIAPFIVPLINNIKNELMTGSGELINSSEKEQHIVFHDDSSTDPTHSMLAKDHFSNVSGSGKGNIHLCVTNGHPRSSTKLLANVLPRLFTGSFLRSWRPLMTRVSTLTACLPESFPVSCTILLSVTLARMALTRGVVKSTSL